MSDTDIPDAVTKRFGSQVKFKPGEEVRMGWYADGTLSMGSFQVFISGPFVASPEGGYLAGTRRFGKVAVIVDFIGKREASFVAGNDFVKARDFQNDAFLFEHNLAEKNDELAADLLELKLSEAFGPQSSKRGTSNFTRLSHPEGE